MLLLSLLADNTSQVVSIQNNPIIMSCYCVEYNDWMMLPPKILILHHVLGIPVVVSSVAARLPRYIFSSKAKLSRVEE